MYEKKCFNKYFGSFVKKKRIEKKWTQLDLAVEMNNNAQNISRLELGKINPTIYWCYLLSQALNISFEELMIEFSEFIKEL
jgi:transcriptional regulator with XRE-family HTH domain